jgi:hypothetical protein
MPRYFQQCCAILICLLTSITAYAIEFKEGEWEITVKQGVKGMPTGMGVTTWRECLTQSKPIPTVYLQARNCDVLEQHAVYKTLRYKLSCFADQGSFTSDGKIHFDAVKLNGDSKSDFGEVAGKNMLVRYKFQGRWIGECH